MLKGNPMEFFRKNLIGMFVHVKGNMYGMPLDKLRILRFLIVRYNRKKMLIFDRSIISYLGSKYKYFLSSD